ncbi:MAG: zinc ribbon domain-containing protein [Acidobacteria bacterium]|nr:zinc ribbon domain-containing protein [Acidobacteriota bacterium]
MHTHCTCGAELPPDARFCHKCGKPQLEMTAAEADSVEDAVVAQAVGAREESKPLEISFRNPAAVRVGLITALVGSILGSLPIPPQGLWLLISLLLAGFLSVFLYMRRTGQALTVASGARMGWITGLFSFVIATVFFTFSVLLITSEGGFAKFYRDQLQDRMGRDADLERFFQMLQTPGGLSTVLLLTLAILFVLFTVFPALGGALGAKVLERDRA